MLHNGLPLDRVSVSISIRELVPDRINKLKNMIMWSLHCTIYYRIVYNPVPWSCLSIELAVANAPTNKMPAIDYSIHTTCI